MAPLRPETVGGATCYLEKRSKMSTSSVSRFVLSGSPLVILSGTPPSDMELEDGEADSVEGRLGCRKLLEDFDAKPRFLDHPADAPDLTFDSIETGDNGLLLCFVEHAVCGVYRERSVELP